MIKNKLKKKNSIWHLYNKHIKAILKFLFYTLAICLITLSIFINRNNIYSFLTINFSLIIKILITITTASILYILLYCTILYATYLKRQQFIPLSKDELDKLNIKTVEEYNNYLLKYLNGFIPIKQIKILCFKSSFYYLLNRKQQQMILKEYIDKNIDKNIDKMNDIDNILDNILLDDFSENLKNQSYSILDKIIDMNLNQKNPISENLNLNPTAIFFLDFDNRHPKFILFGKIFGLLIFLLIALLAYFFTFFQSILIVIFCIFILGVIICSSEIY